MLTAEKREKFPRHFRGEEQYFLYHKARTKFFKTRNNTSHFFFYSYSLYYDHSYPKA